MRRKTLSRVLGLLVLASFVVLLWPGSPFRKAGPPAPPEGDAEGLHLPGSPDSEERGAVPPRGNRRVALAVRNLADGGLLPGVRFVLLRAGRKGSPTASDEVVSDASGRISFRPEGVTALRPESPWFLPAHSDLESLRASGDIWLYRMVEVVGEVTFEGEFRGIDPAEIDLDAFMFPETDDPALPVPPDPWNAVWLATRRLDRRTRLPHPDEEGRFRVKVPAVKGLTMRASRRGMKPAQAPVDIPADPETPAHVRLRLREPPYRIHGFVRDAAGRPVNDIEIEVCIIRDIPISEVLSPKLHEAGHAYTACGRRDGTAYVNYHIWATSGGRGGRGLNDGEFRLAANISGEATILILPPEGYRPLRLRLGNLTANRENLDVVLQPNAFHGKLRLTRHGSPWARASVGFTDMSLGDLQPTIYATTNLRGDVSAHLFEEGHRYWVAPNGPGTSMLKTGWFLYQGQREVDVLKDLRKDL